METPCVLAQTGWICSHCICFARFFTVWISFVLLDKHGIWIWVNMLTGNRNVSRQPQSTDVSLLASMSAFCNPAWVFFSLITDWNMDFLSNITWHHYAIWCDHPEAQDKNKTPSSLFSSIEMAHWGFFCQWAQNPGEWSKSPSTRLNHLEGTSQSWPPKQPVSGPFYALRRRSARSAEEQKGRKHV